MTPKKEKDKKPLLGLTLLSLFFYGAMLFLSVMAEDIHYARLPQITADTPEKQTFSFTATYDEYTVERTGSYTALPKNMVDSGQVFVIETVMKNDFIYYYAKKISVEIDTAKENSDYYAIKSGISNRDMIILTGYETLQDGDEVYLKKEKTKQPEVQTKNIFQ